MNYFAAINAGNRNTSVTAATNTTTKDRDPKFYSELKQLNIDFVKFIDKTHERSPYFDLTPTLNDYIRQFNELEEQYPAGSSGSLGSKPIQLNSQPITFGTGAGGLGSNTNSTTNSGNSGLNTSTNTTSIFSLSSANPPTFTAAIRTTNDTSTSSSKPATTTSSSSIFTSSTPFSFGTPAMPAFNPNPASTTTTTTTNTNANISSVFSPIGSSTTLSFIPNTTSSSSVFAPISSTSVPSFNLNTTTTNSIFNSIGTNPTSLFTAPGLNNTATTVAGPNPTVNSATNDDGANKEGSDEESAPPEPEIDKYEEPDANYQTRCKLYERIKNSSGTSSFNHVGTGVLYVKSMDTNTKLQVIVRLEPDLRRVIMNEVITDKTPLKKLEKAVQMVVAVPNGEPKMYVAKVGDPKLANELYEQITSVKNQTVTSTG